MNKVRSYDRIRESWRARHEPGAIRMLSIFYWRALLCVAFILFVGMLAWGVWELRVTIAILDTTNNSAPNQAPIITRKDVDETVAVFDARQAAYEALKANPLSVQDPSK